jgi:hypothetical protein
MPRHGDDPPAAPAEAAPQPHHDRCRLLNHAFAPAPPRLIPTHRKALGIPCQGVELVNPRVRVLIRKLASLTRDMICQFPKRNLRHVT